MSQLTVMHQSVTEGPNSKHRCDDQEVTEGFLAEKL